jgi:hypothetical protein
MLLPLAVGAAGVALVAAGVFLAINGSEESRLETALNSATETSGVSDDPGRSYASASLNQIPITPTSASEAVGTTTTGARQTEVTSTMDVGTLSAGIVASIAIGESPKTSGPGIREPRVSGMAAVTEVIPSPVNGPFATARRTLARATALSVEPALAWWSVPGSAEPPRSGRRACGMTRSRCLGPSIWGSSVRKL